MIHLKNSMFLVVFFLAFFCSKNCLFAHKPTLDFREQLFIDFPIPPTFDTPCSQLCTFDQFCSDQYLDWCNEMHFPHFFHRKYWEWCYILQVLLKNGKLHCGCRGIGFGVGKEPLVSILAKYGCFIVATDQSFDTAKQIGWLENSLKIEDLYIKGICSKDEFFNRVSYEEVDMNAIPKHLQGFDFTWSSCSLEHLGSIEQGLEFILNSLKCLKSGGIAVHTTEFNLSSNTDTVLSGPTVIYRKKDLDYLINEVIKLGHTVIPLNLNPGLAPLDLYVDFPPYSSYGHLKLSLLDYISTSVGIIIIKK